MTPQPLSEFRLVKEYPVTLFRTPAQLEGSLGESVYVRYVDVRRDTYHNNPNLKLQYQNGVVTGSTVFDSVLIDHILRDEIQGAPRTPLVRDLSDPKVLEMVRGKHYVDARSLVVRSLNDSRNPRNEGLIRTLVEQGSIDVSRLAREPVMLSGLDLELAEGDTDGYGLRLVPNAEFKTEYDDRFLAKWNGARFDETDEIGMPIFKKQGSRVWYTRPEGLSRLVLVRSLYLVSSWYNLGYSDSGGRVVVVGGEATSQNFSELTQEQ